MDNSYKRVLTVQDISCVGQCSLTVALPILSACGLETIILPSAVLSTHTGGFKGFTFRDLTEDIPKIMAHWKSENIEFDAFYSGYLGAVAEINYVKEIANTLLKPGALKIVDPAMADNGKLYYGFDENYVKAMKTLVDISDYSLPNITEASLLTGIEYRENYDEAYVKTLTDALLAGGTKTVVMTGVSYEPSTTGIVVADGDSFQYYRHRKIAKGCHGTGDIFASVFAGMLLRGLAPIEAAKRAGDYVVKCIEYTQNDPSHWYGAKFEPFLGELSR